MVSGQPPPQRESRLRGDGERLLDPKYYPVGGLYAVISFVLLVEAVRFLSPGEEPGNPTAKFAGLLLLATLVVLYTQYLLRRGGRAEQVGSIVRVSLLFGLYGAVVGAIVAIAHVTGTGARLDVSFLVLSATLGGIVIGLPVGNGYVSLQRTKEGAQSQLQLANTVARRISVLQRVLRHNIRTHVNVIAGYLDLLQTTDRSAADATYLETIERHVRKLEIIAENATRLKRVWEVQDQRHSWPVPQLIVRGLEPVAREYPTANVEIETPPDAVVVCHPFVHWAVQEAVRNALVHNDVETTTVEVEIEERDPHVVVDVVDDGRGIPGLETDVLRNPVETQLAHGQGLGLQIIYWTIQTSGGRLELQQSEYGGTRVSMALPLESE